MNVFAVPETDTPGWSGSRLLPLLLFIPIYLFSSLPAGGGVSRLAGALGALGIVFFLPGVFFPPILFPRRRLDFIERLSWSVGLNWLFWLLATTAIKCLGATVTRTNLMLVLIPASLIAAFWAYPRLRFSSIIPPPGKLGILWGAVTGALLLLGLICFRPFLADEDRFWPDEYHRIIGDLKFGSDDADRPRVEWEQTAPPYWRQIGPNCRQPLSGRADRRLLNPTDKRITYPLLFLFDSREEMQLEILFNGRSLFDCYLPPPYESTRCPRNYPPAKGLFSGRVDLSPGENRLDFHFLTAAGQKIGRPPQVLIWDYPGTDRKSFLKSFTSHYLIGDTGDLREQINLARSLKTGVMPFTYSYNGTLFDGGGYTIEHPPFPFFLKTLILVLWEDSLRSFQILFWGLLAFLGYALLTVTTEDAGERQVFPGFLIGVALAVYLFLVRYRVDTPYIATTLSLTVVLALYHLRRRQTSLFLLWATFTVLSKGGIAFIFLGLLSFALAFREWKYPVRLAAAAGCIAIVTLGPTFVASYRDCAAEQWAVLFSGNYGQRFAPLRALIAGDPGAGRFLGQSAIRYFWMANVGSVFAAGAWFLKKKPRDIFFILTSIFSFLLLALSKPSLITAHYSGHRLSYLAPVTFLIVISGVSLLAQYRGPERRKLLVLTILLSFLAFYSIPAILRPYCQALAGTGGEIAHQASVIDFLLRRYNRTGDRADLPLLKKALSRFPSGPGERARPLYYELGRRLKKAGLKEEAAGLFRGAARLKGK